MAKVYGEPSLYIRSMELASRLFSYFVILTLFLFSIIVLDFVYETLPKFGLVFVLYLFVIIFISVSVFWLAIIKYKESFKSWNDYSKGRTGEKWVRAKLRTELSDDYSVFLNVQRGKFGDIDFIVVGPTGVFSIEVKQSSVLRKDVFKKNLKRVSCQALNIQKEIGVDFVSPILVIAECSKGMGRYGVVDVANRDGLVDLIKNNNKAFSADLILRVVKKVNGMI